VRVADEGFDAYVWGNDFSFEVGAYGVPEMGKRVEQWPLERILPYRKCYGIDPEEFASFAMRGQRDFHGLPGRRAGRAYRGQHQLERFCPYRRTGVALPARRHGVAKALLDVAQFWSRKKNLPGMMLETQNNNLGACRLYERCGYVMGGIDHLRYRGIDPQPVKWRFSGIGCSRPNSSRSPLSSRASPSAFCVTISSNAFSAGEARRP
jgi:GNAT superfamily N-acetyltransferase